MKLPRRVCPDPLSVVVHEWQAEGHEAQNTRIYGKAVQEAQILHPGGCVEGHGKANDKPERRDVDKDGSV